MIDVIINIIKSPAVIILTSAISVNLLLAIFVFKNNPKGATNKIFGLLSILLSLWLIAMYSSQQEYFMDISLFLSRLTFFLATPMDIMFLLLAYNAPNPQFVVKKKYVTILTIIAIFIMLLSLSPYTFTNIEIKDGSPRPITGTALPIVGGFNVFLVIAAAWTLFKRTKKVTGIQKQQLNFVMYGIALMFGLIITTIFIPVLIFEDARFVIISPLYSIIFLSMTAYAIIKHKLLDIKLILMRAVSYIFVLTALAFIYAAVLLFGTKLFFNYKISVEDLIFNITIIVIAALGFQPLYKLMKKFTDKIFFKGAYSTEELLTRFGHIISGTIDLEVLTTVILRILLKEMRISKGAFLIIDEHKIINIKQIGFIDHQLSAQQLELLFHYIPLYKIFIFEEMEEGELKNFFRKTDIVVALPIRVETNEVAILTLGPKLSGEIYSTQDIDFLKIFSSQIGVAIQNAKSYALLQQFNIELEKRVEERTKELKNTQEKELAKAKEINRLKDEFVFIAAHELQTPVTVIRGFLDLVSEAQSKFPKDIQDYLNSMKNASGNLSQLINDLLEIARSENNTTKIEVKPINTMTCIKDEIKKIKPIADRRNIKINFKMPKKSPKIMADLIKTKEVIGNLLNNAVKYNKENGNVDLSIIERDDDIVIEIRDTGYGIAEKEQKKIFQKFFRSIKRETIEVTGTGLGLFITRMLIEKMGGKIMFSSVEGKGSTFAFSLPKAKI